MQGSYHVGNTASRPISEVKQRWAVLVLAWETSLEPTVTLRFFPCIVALFLEMFFYGSNDSSDDVTL